MSSKSAHLPRYIAKSDFEKAYQKTIISNNFFEKDSYYVKQKPRYFYVIRELGKYLPSKQSSVLEIGGGQIALLAKELFGDECTVVDLNETYKQGILNHDVQFQCCDLLRDDLKERNAYDLVVMCEVIEHFPVPPHTILEKIRAWLKPGGLIFITTPNLYRFRNLVRLALGLRVFDTFFIPERGRGIGHPFEYSQTHLKWQLETAGFESVNIQLRQLDNAGSSLWTQLGRITASPFLLRPLWRDKLVALARKKG
ncbi:MAG: class I SAM-dependent methyltransferase [Cyanobacteria bacterium QH_9_48_43]|jgi:SAM-dependent methyltransferase|nr:MAG: class I SAM-dependent methyltransferase [Cyanobacteria bacterium QH_2_48_84]PSO75174.1 MAG: class I SAM-dependent methyltransferase [Cyanobacteria bacterium QH_3_48_40]PSO85494.1 MAG: class I SAM-dependent methyltransferase [Cyanobacteria bacterium QS_5_48_63]PSO89922.1 MAG: class I SAM-dependent methyltransferase [Cyanobacteria bacterium QH_9_48_43]PSO91768.1 MAG: class I SAM-dependent methyltransferase [Cyanobacteria bacterium QS_3_48_167]PSO93566.1 MAG: class I SAM-dependent methylt